jgi:hypothetical protein
MNPGLAKTIGTLLKQDFQRAVLNRIPQMQREPELSWRELLFLCDEYQGFATVGENDPSGDEKFFALSRQAKCIPIIATQSISSLRSTLPGESWRTLIQTFRTKIFPALSDDFSARTASDLCGKEEQLKPNYTLSETGQDARVSRLTGRAVGHPQAPAQPRTITSSKPFTKGSEAPKGRGISPTEGQAGYIAALNHDKEGHHARPPSTKNGRRDAQPADRGTGGREKDKPSRITLPTMGRFHRYSWANVLLIASQRPTATHVAGCHTWRALGRQVKRDEKGITIFVPVLVKQRESSPDRSKSRRDAYQERRCLPADGVPHRVCL